MFWTVVMTSETGVADVATGATTTGFDASVVAAVVPVLIVRATGFDSGAAAFVAGATAFVAGAAGSVVAAGEFVLVSDADAFVTATVALESEPVPFVADVAGSVAAGGTSGTVVAVSIAGATALVVGVTGSAVDAGTSGADAVSLVADAASVESEATVVSEAPGSDCVAATADSLSPHPGCTAFVTVVDGRAAVDCRWGCAPQPCVVAPAGPVAPALDPTLLLSADELSWPWASAPLAPESAAAITPPLLPTRTPANSKQATAAKRRCVKTMASSPQVTSLWLSWRHCCTARPSAIPILN
jgi:hypothetical protein